MQGEKNAPSAMDVKMNLSVSNVTRSYRKQRPAWSAHFCIRKIANNGQLATKRPIWNPAACINMHKSSPFGLSGFLRNLTSSPSGVSLH